MFVDLQEQEVTDRSVIRAVLVRAEYKCLSFNSTYGSV